MKRILIIFLVLSVICFAFYNKGNTGLYDVVEVFDGDTIAVNMAGRIEKVRLIGIDTPETKDPRKPVQCYGPEASEYSYKKLNHAKVRLVADPLSTNRDRYDRLLRYVYLADGTFYNQDLLLTGNARSYTGFPFSKKAKFIDAEYIGKNNKAGLWSLCENY